MRKHYLTLAIIIVILLMTVACTPQDDQPEKLQEISYPISPDIMKLDYIDPEMTVERLEEEQIYVSKEINEISTEAEVEILYDMGGFRYNFMDGVYGDKIILMSASIFSLDLIGPLGIQVGDSEELLREKYPDTYINGVGSDAEGNYVFHTENDMRFVPEGIMPFMIVYFEEGAVSEIKIVYWRF